MLALFMLIGVASARGGDVEIVCASEATAARLSLARAAEEPGRYRVQHCRAAPAQPAAWQWDLTLKVLDQPPENCTYSRLGERPNGPLHSESLLDFTPDVNCTYVCLAQNMDLLFRGCYSVQSKCKVGRFSSEPYNTYHYIDNDLTPEYFHNSSQWYKPFDHENMVSFIWETKIPITDYEVTMCKYSNETEEESCEGPVTHNCTLQASAHRLACALQAGAGCRRLTLRHRAPWAAGLFRHLALVHGDYCYEGAPPAPVAGTQWSTPWAVAAAALGAALVLATLLLARHRRLDRQLKKRVLLHWRARADEVEQQCGAPLEGVLLLHARDCAALERLVRALAALLRRHGATVWELYSPEAVSVSGASPADWLRSLLNSPRVRIVLLQTPALRLLHPAAPSPPNRVALPTPTVEHFMAPLSYCLLADLCNHSWVPECGRDYADQTEVRTFRDECDLLEYNCDYDRVEEPLLERRVVHRVPHCGDALLQLAVRSLADAAPTAAAPYRRHYLATVSSLETEALHDVVPYRRYALPAAIGALLRDLAPPGAAPPPTAAPPPGAAPPPDTAPPGTAPPDEALRELYEAHEELLQYVRDNPDYLSQELMFI